jgi:putative metallohydrolase (TIGR04338 family)
MQDKSGKTLASVDFVNLGNNRLDIDSIDYFDEGKGYATKVLEKLYSSFPEHSIFWGKTIVPASTHLAQKFSDKYGRTEFMPWGEGVIAGYEWGQLYGDTTVKKHQEHDQSTHGNWATGTPQGGNGLAHREIYQLQSGTSDSLMRKIYDAEERFQPNVQRDIPKPFPPSRTEFQTSAEYDKAFKAYSKAFDEWSRESTRNIKSTTGEKHLDGTKAGVQAYVNAVTSADWFIEAFGDGGVVGTPKVSLRAMGAAGQYSIGTKGGVGYSALAMDKGYSKAEPVILHELAHYATAISATSSYGGHGVEFAKNHIYMASKVLSPEYAAGLEKAYREAGVPLG